MHQSMACGTTLGPFESSRAVEFLLGSGYRGVEWTLSRPRIQEWERCIMLWGVALLRGLVGPFESTLAVEVLAGSGDL
jgi:hypothetical protein